MNEKGKCRRMSPSFYKSGIVRVGLGFLLCHCILYEYHTTRILEAHEHDGGGERSLSFGIDP